MNPFDQFHRIDALVSAQMFGEPIVYYPMGDLTKGRTVFGVVDRNPTAPMRFDQRTGSADDIVVTVANDPDQGVSGVTAGRDSFDVPTEPGSPTKRNLTIFKVEAVDAGMFRLRLR